MRFSESEIVEDMLEHIRQAGENSASGGWERPQMQWPVVSCQWLGSGVAQR